MCVSERLNVFGGHVRETHRLPSRIPSATNHVRVVCAAKTEAEKKKLKKKL